MRQLMEFLGNLLKLVAWGNITINLQTLIEGEEPKRVALEFVRWVNNGCRLTFVVRSGDWPVWRMFKIGGKSVARLTGELMTMLGDNNFTRYAKSMLAGDKFVPTAKSTKIEFVRVRVRDLGFDAKHNLPTTSEVLARADELGLDKCPHDAAAHIRLAYKDQPRGEDLWVMSDPLPDSDSGRRVFGLRHNNEGLWLDGDYPHPDVQWYLVNELLFARRKPASQAST